MIDWSRGRLYFPPLRSHGCVPLFLECKASILTSTFASNLVDSVQHNALCAVQLPPLCVPMNVAFGLQFCWHFSKPWGWGGGGGWDLLVFPLILDKMWQSLLATSRSHKVSLWGPLLLFRVLPSDGQEAGLSQVAAIPPPNASFVSTCGSSPFKGCFSTTVGCANPGQPIRFHYLHNVFLFGDKINPTHLGLKRVSLALSFSLFILHQCL